MNASEFKRVLAGQKEQFRNYMYNKFPMRAGFIALRFIDGNFKAQGYRGATFQAWPANRKKTTILIKSGILRRGTFYNQILAGAHIINNVKYAAVHNNGFNGTVQVKGFKRRKFRSTKVGTGALSAKGKMKTNTVHSLKGTSEVKAHTRRMNIPKRQFMPNNANDSPVLVDEIKKDIVNELKKIFK